MTTTRATLSTLVQCRPLWFWHVWGALTCAIAPIRALVSVEAREGVIFSLLVVPLWTGVISSSLYKDFLTKPFTCCVPRHPHVWRRTLFLIALAVAGACALEILLVRTGSPGVVALAAWQAFILCLAMFMVAVYMATVTPNAGFLPAMITAFLLIVLNDDLGGYIRVSVEGALLANPLVTTVTCATIIFAGWRYLGAPGLVRRHCGEPYLGLHGAFRADRSALYQAQRKLRSMRRSPSALMNSLERFFINRMEANSGNATLKSLWGTLYVQSGKIAPATSAHFLALSVFLVALSLAMGYYHPHRLAPGISGANLILFLICMINAEYRVNPYAGLLLNVNRMHRFRSLIFSALIQWMLLAVFAVALTAASIAAGALLNEVTIYGNSYVYTPIHPKAFFIFAPMVPFLFLSQILFPRYSVIALMAIAIAGTIAFFATGDEILRMSAFGILLIQLVSWVPFVAFIRYHCYSRDLKLNGQ